MVKSVCVYCASSSKVDVVYLNSATELGKQLALNGIRCIYGAGENGLMGALADAVLANNGHITGIIPQFMCDENWHHKGRD
jgi:predicted Rossmann-fold nucleotide-binding protein